MRYLRTNTAVRKSVGPFLDKTDGVTPETALTITNERITLIADTDDGSAPTIILDNITGATSGTANDLNYITGQDNGMMEIELAAADLNRLGHARLTITDAANHCPVIEDFTILPAVVFDALVLGTDLLQVDVTQLLGTAWLTPGVAGTPDVNAKLVGATAQTGLDLGANITSIVNRIGAFTGTGINTILGFFQSLFRTDAGTPSDIGGTYDPATMSLEGFDATALTEAQITADMDANSTQLAKLGTPAAASISADILAIDNFVDGIESTLASGVALSSSERTTLTAVILGLTRPTGAVTTDAGNSATSFETDLASAVDDYYKDMWLTLTSGALISQTKKVTAYNGTTKIITVSGGFTATPADGVTFVLVNI